MERNSPTPPPGHLFILQARPAARGRRISDTSPTPHLGIIFPGHRETAADHGNAGSGHGAALAGGNAATGRRQYPHVPCGVPRDALPPHSHGQEKAPGQEPVPVPGRDADAAASATAGVGLS